MEKTRERWQAGGVEDFELLFREHGRAVYRTAYLMCGSNEEAEDVTQEVFLSAWRSRQTYDPSRAGLSTWLHRITVNECMKNHRGESKMTSTIEGLDLPEPQNRQPEEILVTKTEYEALLATLAGMTKKQRVVLVLKYFNDLSYSEIAEILSIPLGTVKSRLNEALGCLRKRMAAKTRA